MDNKATVNMAIKQSLIKKTYASFNSKNLIFIDPVHFVSNPQENELCVFKCVCAKERT